MASLREIFGKNLRENRRKCGLSQEKLAEKAGISTHYLAMMEISRNFPTSEILERLAGALGIEVYELFLIDHSPRAELERLRQDIVSEIKQLVSETLEQTGAIDCKPKARHSPHPYVFDALLDFTLRQQGVRFLHFCSVGY